MLHFLLHLLGIDTQQSYAYDFWSGVGTQLAVLGGTLAALKHHNCHKKGCWRLGHVDPKHGFPSCRKHHSLSGEL